MLLLKDLAARRLVVTQTLLYYGVPLLKVCSMSTEPYTPCTTEQHNLQT